MAKDDETTLSIRLGPDELVATFKPPLTADEQRAIDDAAHETARNARQVSEVVRVLMIHAAKAGRTLSIETNRGG